MNVRTWCLCALMTLALVMGVVAVSPAQAATAKGTSPSAAAISWPVTFTVSNFSPNGDGQHDVAYLHFSFPTAATSVSWYISRYQAARSVAQVTDEVALGDLAAGDHEVVWDGKLPSGKLATDGGYVLWILASPAGGNGPHLVHSSHFLLDTKGPSLSFAAISPSVFPVKDGYRDTVAVGVKTTERVSSLVLTLTNSAGHVVRRWTGQRKVVWDGRTAARHVVKPGAYAFQWSARDALANFSTSRSRTVTVSPKTYVMRTKVVTISAQASRFYAAKTPCAKLLTPAPGRGWKDSDGLRATYCPDNDPTRTYPEVQLFGKVDRPKGLGRWTMQVDVYGASGNSSGDVKLSPAYGGTGPWLDEIKDVPRGTGWHTVLHVKEAAGYTDAEWVLVAGAGANYDVRSYRVTMRYHLLV